MERVIYDEHYFAGRAEEASQIADQNERYAITLVDEDFDGSQCEDFRQLTQNELRDEQAKTLIELAGRDNSPYEDLAVESLKVESDLATTKQRLGEVSDVDESQRERLVRAAKRAIELAPTVKDRADMLLSQKVEELPENPTKHELAQLAAQLSVRLGHLEGLQEAAGQAWPMPMIPKETEVTVVEIDEIPVDPDSLDTAEAKRELIETHGRTYQASLNIAAHLEGVAGSSVTPNEIAEAIYTDPAHFEGMTAKEEESCRRKRVERLLNKTDTLVKDILLDGAGLTLQYGWRHFVDIKTGQDARNRRRIYRAIEGAPGEEAPDAFIETTYVSDGRVVDSPEFAGEMTAPTKEEKRLRHIEGVVSILANNDLMPELTDETFDTGTLRSDFMQSRSYFDHLNSPAIDALRSFVLGLSNNHRGLNAQELVFAAVGDAFGKRLGKKNVHAIKRIIQSVVADYYESHEADDYDEEISA